MAIEGSEGCVGLRTHAQLPPSKKRYPSIEGRLCKAQASDFLNQPGASSGSAEGFVGARGGRASSRDLASMLCLVKSCFLTPKVRGTE